MVVCGTSAFTCSGISVFMLFVGAERNRTVRIKEWLIAAAGNPKLRARTSMDVIWKTDFVIAHTACLARSLKHWTGRYLMPAAANPVDLAEHVFEAPFVLVSHGTERDPI